VFYVFDKKKQHNNNKKKSALYCQIKTNPIHERKFFISSGSKTEYFINANIDGD
jgi:hypothetical protein